MEFPTKMRLKFEKWAKENGDCVAKKMLTCDPPKDGGYVSPKVQDMWEAWKAAVFEYQRCRDE